MVVTTIIIVIRLIIVFMVVTIFVINMMSTISRLTPINPSSFIDQKAIDITSNINIELGMFSLLHDGLIKAQRGDTSLQEILETLGTEKI